jgi:hypothetical protein
MRLGPRTIVGAAVTIVLAAGCGGGSAGSGPDGARRAQPAAGQGAAAGVSAHPGHGAAHRPPPAAPLRAGERFLNLSMVRPYTPAPPGGGTDEYRCFLVDPKLTRRTFLTGSQFLPQNPAIVHHAIFFRVEPGDVAEARRLDAAAAGDGWTCFGGTGIGGGGAARQLSAGASWIAAWAPGGRERLLRSRTGYLLEPGSQVVMQVHYSLLATGGKPAGADRSGIRLRLVDGAGKGGADLDPLQTTLLPGAVELPCGPGESGPLCDRDTAVLDVMRRFGEQAGSAVAGLNLVCNNGAPPAPGPVQSCDHRVRQAGTVHAVAGHMHLLGRSIKVELNPGTPRARTLLDVPAYDFDDQGARPLTRPVQVKPADTYRVTCTHDATLRRKLPQLRGLEPRYVVWGDGTSDEMCLGTVIWSRPRGSAG